MISQWIFLSQLVRNNKIRKDSLQRGHALEAENVLLSENNFYKSIKKSLWFDSNAAEYEVTVSE